MRVLLLLTAIIAAGCAGDVSDQPSPIATASPRPLPPAIHDEFRSTQVGGLRYRFWPRSAPIEPGVTYLFSSGHCGLTWLTDFDGSFWEPLAPPGGPDPDPFINDYEGTMTLVGPDEAEFRDWGGPPIELRRIDGPVITRPCA